MRGERGSGEKKIITALGVLLNGTGRGIKAKTVGRWLRADQARNENGQSIEGMRKICLSVNDIGNPHG